MNLFVEGGGEFLIRTDNSKIRYHTVGVIHEKKKEGNPKHNVICDSKMGSEDSPPKDGGASARRGGNEDMEGVGNEIREWDNHS